MDGRDVGQECCKMCIIALCRAHFTRTDLHPLLTATPAPLCNACAGRAAENILKEHPHVLYFSFPLVFPRQGRILNILGCLWNFCYLAVTSGCPFLHASRQSIWMQHFLTGCVQASDLTSSATSPCCFVVVINGCCTLAQAVIYSTSAVVSSVQRRPFLHK